MKNLIAAYVAGSFAVSAFGASQSTAPATPATARADAPKATNNKKANKTKDARADATPASKQFGGWAEEARKSRLFFVYTGLLLKSSR